MARDDALVRRARISVRSLHGSAATATLRDAEGAIWTALNRTARTVGDEVVVLRSARIRLRVKWEDGSADARSALEVAFERALHRQVAQARRAAERTWVSADAAFFASSSVAAAEYFAALSRGHAESWPFRALRHLGETPASVVATRAREGSDAVADLLAELAQSLGLDELARTAAPYFVAHLNAWIRDDGLDLGELPADLRERVEASFAQVDPAVPGAVLARLATIFAHWPPARDRGVRRSALEMSQSFPSTRPKVFAWPSEIRESRRAGVRDGRWRSTAGGLAVWACVAVRSGFAAALDGACTSPRELMAAKWALARALEGRFDAATDPMTLVFAGGSPDDRVHPAALTTEVAELVERAALAFALDRGWLESNVIAFPVATGCGAVTTDGTCIAHIFDVTPDDAVPEIVRRFVRATGRAPRSVETRRRHDAGAHVIVDVDVPNLPDRWRSATACAASVLLHAAHRSQLRFGVADLRRWPAVVEQTADGYAVLLPPAGAAALESLDTLDCQWGDHRLLLRRA